MFKEQKLTHPWFNLDILKAGILFIQSGINHLFWNCLWRGWWAPNRLNLFEGVNTFDTAPSRNEGQVFKIVKRTSLGVVEYFFSNVENLNHYWEFVSICGGQNQLKLGWHHWQNLNPDSWFFHLKLFFKLCTVFLKNIFFF